MEYEQVIDLLSYTVPALVVGVLALYFFREQYKNENRRLKLLLLKETRQQTLTIKLQAYERMLLYLERINPSKLVSRITSVNNDKIAYLQSLATTINKELEHNTTQQIYISNACWNTIVKAKDATIFLLQKIAETETITTADAFKKEIIKQIEVPSVTAQLFLKNEVSNLL